jgi:hypothetical protein
VLDFGLAKAEADKAAESDLGQSPTVSVGPTRDGMILGTPVYETGAGVRQDRR